MNSEETATTEAAPVGRAPIAEIEEAMKDVVDPELGINVVDLGLIYGVTVDQLLTIATIGLAIASSP